MTAPLVGALDAGTTSTRFILFDARGRIVAQAQREHEQIFPRPGWVEHDADEIWRNAASVMRDACATVAPGRIAAVGITNQRETAVVWERATGQPIHNALVWQDTRVDALAARLARDGGRDRFRAATGLPLASYFSGLKVRWPSIVSSSAVIGPLGGPDVPLEGVPLAGILGDQQAALFGQACFAPGEAKNTYGTGSFVLMNTGPKPVRSKAGLITTVAYRLGEAPPAYALEGSIAVTGALVQWLRDNLGLIEASADIEALARTVEDNGDVFIVPAFSGLYAPWWDAGARGLIAGLTRYATKGHIARAALEAAAYQTRDVLRAMAKDSRLPIRELRCDGGMAASDLLMQFQADILNRPTLRPKMIETTALGAAYAAGLAVGVWPSTAALAENWAVDRRWQPRMAAKRRRALTRSWGRAVERSLGWIEER